MSHALPLSLVILHLLGITRPGQLGAQAMQPLSDARIVELVGGVAIDRYSDLIARASVDTTTHPVNLQFPTTGPVELWQRFGAHLSRMMRGRPPVDSDSSMRLLHIREVTVATDSLRAWVSTGFATNCRPGWAEDRVDHEVIWVRRSHDFWERVSDEPWVYSESFGRCRFP